MLFYLMQNIQLLNGNFSQSSVVIKFNLLLDLFIFDMDILFYIIQRYAQIFGFIDVTRYRNICNREMISQLIANKLRIAGEMA